jgi:hypothetical protein
MNTPDLIAAIDAEISRLQQTRHLVAGSTGRMDDYIPAAMDRRRANRLMLSESANVKNTRLIARL